MSSDQGFVAPSRRRGLRSNDNMQAEDAEGFVSEGISRIRAKMSTSGKTYPPPSIPDTPSKTINNMLQARCGQTVDSSIKHTIAKYICFIFTAITKVYSLIYKESKPSQTMWMAACGIVSVGVILKSFLLYYIVVGCSVLLYHLLFYATFFLALFGVAVSVSGVIFFDKEPSTKKQSPGFESEPSSTRSGYTSSKLE